MAKRRARKKVAHRRKLQNRFGMFMISLVVLVLVVIVGVDAYEKIQERDELLAKRDEYTKLIAQEQQRAEEIEEYGKYTKTLKFYEEQAKLKLGLVYEDEIIFIPNN